MIGAPVSHAGSIRAKRSTGVASVVEALAAGPTGQDLATRLIEAIR